MQNILKTSSLVIRLLFPLKPQMFSRQIYRLSCGVGIISALCLTFSSCGKKSSNRGNPYADGQNDSAKQRTSPYPEPQRSQIPEGVKLFEIPLSKVLTDAGNPKEATALAAMVFDFRISAMLDLDAAISKFGIERTAFLNIDERQIARDVPTAYPYFFSGSLVLGGNFASSTPTIAFYNPFLDLMLLGQWSLSTGGKLRVEGLQACSGAAFILGKSPSPRAPPLWVLGNGALPPSIANLALSVANRFAELCPATGSGELPVIPELPLDIFEARCLVAIKDLVSASPGFPSHPNQLRTIATSIRNGIQSEGIGNMLPANNILTADQLLSLPKDYRSGIELAFVLSTTQGSLLCFLNPGLPVGFYAAHVDSLNGTQQLRDLAYFSFGFPYM